MVFSSITFLYYFLPVTLAVYFLMPMPNGSPRFRNTVLLLASLVFYAWGEPVYFFLLAFQCTSAWGFGLLIEKYRGRAGSRALMAAAVAICLSALLFFKYSDFFLENANSLFGTNIRLFGLALPIGVSFYTFQILSYIIDLYRGNTAVNKNVLEFSTYVTMFPQLIAGPIVRYSDVAEKLLKRGHSMKGFTLGIRRFVVGLGKKVLIANTMGEVVVLFKASGENSVLFAWLYVASFALQIYFDFSGYSDMAIGMGHMLGIEFLENFDYPYTAISITDFWRRWHKSLSSWFRDYVYIPLGGNRVPQAQYVFNMIVVWFLTGFWHGADWNFIFWGLYYAAILLVEKRFLSKLLDRLPRAFRRAYVILLVLIGWVLFDAAGMGAAGATILQMFGIGADSFAGMESTYYLRSYLVPLLIGVVACTRAPKMIAAKLLASRKVFTFLEPAALGAMLIMVTAYLVDGSYNPFIYFRF